jgi:hypothetical protein
VGTGAKVSVAKELLGVAGGKPETCADGEGERIAVLAEKANVGADSKIADSAARVAVDELSVDHASPGRSVLDDGDGEAHPEAQAIEEDERSADVQVELIGDDARVLGAVWIVEDVGLVRVVGDDAERGTQVAADVERVVGEPLASALGRLESIEEEPGGGLRLRGMGREAEGAASQREQRESLQAALARSTFHGSSPEM